MTESMLWWLLYGLSASLALVALGVAVACVVCSVREAWAERRAQRARGAFYAGQLLKR